MPLAQLRPEAEAQRTLEAVSAVLG
jgi:hypothetical protein